MSETTTGVRKTCVFCGEDCSNRPRIKDTQGRYACKACAQRQGAPADGGAGAVARAARKPQAAAPSPVMVDLLKDIVGEEQAAPASPGSSPCPTCGVQMAAGAVICTRCGYNAQTGKAARTQLKRPEVVKGPRKRRAGRSIGVSGSTFALIVLGLLGALFGLSFVAPEFAIAYCIVTVLYTIIYVAMLIVTPFQEGETGWGICVIASLFIGILGFAVLYYVLAVSERTSLKIMLLAQVLAWIGLIVMYPMIR